MNDRRRLEEHKEEGLKIWAKCPFGWADDFKLRTHRSLKDEDIIRWLHELSLHLDPDNKAGRRAP